MLVKEEKLQNEKRSFVVIFVPMGKKKKHKKQYAQQLLKQFRNHPKKHYNYKQLAALLKITDTKGRNELIKTLKTLKAQGALTEPSRGKYSYLLRSSDYIEGTLDVTSSGNAYLLTEEDQDIFIGRKSLNRAFDGDLVQVYVYKSNSNGRREGEVASIISRKTTEFVGTLERQEGFGFVACTSPKMYTDFFIAKGDLENYKNGERVVVALKDWPAKTSSPNGTIVRSLGQPGEMETEMHTILYDYQLPAFFPDAIEKAAATIDTTISKAEIAQRKDYRDILTFTIDPATAKDFDDALSFQQLPNGRFELGVHIADVSHYVKEGTPLDDEAFDRGTSVYLVDRVVPMLPEVLSNQLCSLRPKEEKYTFAATFEMDNTGKVYKEWFGRTVINSDQRFTYEEVQHALEHNTTQIPATVALEKKELTLSNEIFSALTTLNTTAQQLRKKRMKNGAISFDRVEINFHLDEDSNPEGVWFKTSKNAHQLIEEFMLLANRHVAQFIGKQMKKPFVFRVHDEPDPEKIDNLALVVKGFGYNFKPKNERLQQELNQLLIDISGKKEQHLIDTLTVRCMSKAVYTTENIGHYGLAFDYYTHFTSPIRRYPDVMVHRLLAYYLNGGKKVNQELLEEACIHASQREQLATKAERDSIKYMQVKFMANKLGQHFDGIISGVTDRGIYVELIDNKCEGMVSIKAIPGDYFEFDPAQHALIGLRTHQRYTLGDPVTIEVKKANLIKRQLDFDLVQPTT